jgi:Holliday junction DNA helicase RuvA
VISRLRGTLLSQIEEVVEVATPGGVVYEVDVPLSVVERLPPVGREIELLTLHIVREDLSALFGFLEAGERELFRRLLGVSGVGGRLALAMLSTYPAARLARALVEKDIAALVQISGVGKKTAERLCLELADRVRDLDLAGGAVAPSTGGGVAQEAVRALTALGMSFQEADSAVHEVLGGEGTLGTNEIVRKALARR